MKLVQSLRKFARDDQGVTAMEYGLIAALVAVVIIIPVGNVGTNLAAVFGYIAPQLANAL